MADQMTQIEAMTAEVRDFCFAKGWRSDQTTFGEYTALLHSELSEALEAYRDYRLGRRHRDLYARKHRRTHGR